MAKQTIDIGSAANDGTGDALRTAFDKANDNFDELYNSAGNSSTINVLDEGADATGAADSLAAFDAAIAAAVAGDRIYIPTGTYTLSNTWVINKQVTVFGPGTINESSVLAPVVEVTADRVQIHDITITGSEVIGTWNTSVSTIHDRAGLHVNAADDVLVSRVRVTDKSTGIKITGANRTTLRDVLWQGIDLSSQPSNYAESAGLRTASGLDLLVSGGSWTLGGRGMALEGVTTARLAINGATIYGCESDGIYINDPSGVQILGGYIQGVDGEAINIEDGDTLTIQSVYARSTAANSLKLGTGAITNLKIPGCDFQAVTLLTGTYDDIDFDGADITTLTTTSGGTLKGIKGKPKSITSLTHGATTGVPSLTFDVMSFGATGDGSTNDTAAIQAAMDAAGSTVSGDNYPTVIVPQGKFIFNDTLTVPEGVNLICNGVLYYTGTQDRAALVIDNNGNDKFMGTYVVDVYGQGTPTWTDNAYIGVDFRDCENARIRIKRAERFTIGAQLHASGFDCKHNVVKLGRLVNNKYGFRLFATNPNGCNENTVLSGRIAMSSGFLTSTAAYGIWLDGTSANDVNNNHFWAQSIELHGAGASAERIPVLIDAGRRNVFMNLRSEGNDDEAAKITTAGSYDNRIHMLLEENGDGRMQISDSSQQGNLLMGHRHHEQIMFPARHITIHEDWISNGTIAGANAMTSGTAGTGAVAWGAGVAAHPGIITLSASASSDSAFVQSGSDAAFFVGGGELVFEAVVNINTLSDATDEYLFRIGLSADDAALGSANVYFEYRRTTGPTWYGGVRDGTTNSVATSHTVTTGWVKLRFTVSPDGSTVSYAINDELITTRDTNVPTGRMRMNAHLVKSAGSTQRDIDIDYMAVTKILSTTR